MAETRYRYRLGGLLYDVKNTPASVTPPIHLGQFRDKLVVYHNGVPEDAGWGNPYNVQSYTPMATWSTFEQTYDELHHRSKGQAPPKVKYRQGYNPEVSYWDTGGPFLSMKIDNGIPTSGVIGSGVYFNYNGSKKYEGGFMPPVDALWGSGWWGLGSASIFSSSNNQYLPDISAYFDRVWRSAKPKLELASLYVFLREIGDTVPMLKTTAELFGTRFKDMTNVVYIKGKLDDVVISHGSNLESKKMVPQLLADNYINQEFGWLPFLGDLKAFFQTYLDARDFILHLTNENGKWVRKKVKVPIERSSTVLTDVVLPYDSTSYSVPCFPVNFPSEFFQMPPSWNLTEVVETTVSASGKFRFYRPEFDITLPDYQSAWNQVMRAVKIYGLSVSPYHIWQATPWTWLLDWVSNIGSYLQRFSDTLEDEVAASYFFVTAHRTVERIFTIKLPFYSGLETLVFKRRFVSKQRVSADSPYGFSLSWDRLDPRKLAILASLGISRNSFTHGR